MSSIAKENMHQNSDIKSKHKKRKEKLKDSNNKVKDTSELPCAKKKKSRKVPIESVNASKTLSSKNEPAKSSKLPCKNLIKLMQTASNQNSKKKCLGIHQSLKSSKRLLKSDAWVNKTSFQLHLSSCSQKQLTKLLEATSGTLTGVVNIECGLDESQNAQMLLLANLAKGSRFQLQRGITSYSKNLCNLEVNALKLSKLGREELRSLMKAKKVKSLKNINGDFSGIYRLQYDSADDADKIMAAGSVHFRPSDTSVKNRRAKRLTLICPRYIIGLPAKEDPVVTLKPETDAHEKINKTKRKNVEDDGAKKKKKRKIEIETDTHEKINKMKLKNVEDDEAKKKRKNSKKDSK